MLNQIDEGGMSRQVQHSKKRSTAVLTANRGDKSSKENKARNKELGKKVRSMGYGYKKVKGEYPETDSKTGEKKTVSEPSIAVNAPKKKFRKFKKQMKRLSEKNGWFVPTYTLLEYLRKQNKESIITPKQRAALERKWLVNKLFLGAS